MSWDGFMKMERRQLQERRNGKLRRALGRPLPEECVEELGRLGEEDHRRADAGLVAVMGDNGAIFYKHIDDLTRQDMRARIAAERVQIAWLKERIARLRRGAIPPSYERLPRISLPGTAVNKARNQPPRSKR